MNRQNTYETIEKQIREGFTDEAGTLLDNEQINRILSEEEHRIRQAKQIQLPANRWMGSNLQRYCKDLLRRHQPFFTLYYLLGVCTEASLFLFFLYLVRAALAVIVQPISFTAVPGAVLFLMLWKETNQSFVRRQLTKAGPDSLSSSAASRTNPARLLRLFRVLSFLGYALVISFVLISQWQNLRPLLARLSLQNTFLAAVGFLFLSGMHNVLYQSRFVSFFMPGILRITKRSEAAIQAAAKPYFARKTNDLRSHLLADRVYLFAGFLIALLLDLLCLYQNFHDASLSLRLFGLAVLLVTILLLIGIISCNELLRQLKQTNATNDAKP